MLKNDPRVAYIANVVSAVCGADFSQSVAESKDVARFLNELHCMTLQCVSNGQEVQFESERMANVDASFLELHFVKLGAVELTAQNMTTNVLTSTTRNSAVQSLYQYMQAVYTPLLVEDKENPQNISPEMKTLMQSLCAGLANKVRRGET